MTHPYDGCMGLTADEQDDLDRTPLQRLADALIVLLLVGGFIIGWAALVRWVVWGWW